LPPNDQMNPTVIGQDEVVFHYDKSLPFIAVRYNAQ
jgi:hypothetical protein